MSKIDRKLFEIQAKFEETIQADREHREKMLSIEDAKHTFLYASHEEKIKKERKKQVANNFRNLTNPAALLKSNSNSTSSGKGKFAGLKNILLGVLDLSLSVVFIAIMFLIANTMFFPLLSESIRPIAWFATLIFSLIVIWRA